MPLLDLTQPLHSGSPVFPCDPQVRLRPVPQEPPWSVTALELGSHSGTHMDSSVHCRPGAAAIDAYPLERFVLECAVVHLALGAGQTIAWDDVAAALPAEPAGRGLLLHTGWDAHWGTDEALRHPFLSAGAARRLAGAGLSLVGTDAFNVDDSVSGASAVHDVLLGAGLLLVENLTGLSALQSGTLYTCAFVPLKLAGCDGSPIRAFAWV